MNRRQRIHDRLQLLEGKGIIRSHYCSGDSPGLRWIVEGVGFSSRTFTTAEVEIFLLGISEGRTSKILDFSHANT